VSRRSITNQIFFFFFNNTNDGHGHYCQKSNFFGLFAAVMPTRAAVAAAAAANMRTTRSRKMATQPSGSGKENASASLPSTTKGKEKAASKKAARNVKAKKVEEVLFCSCRGLDDGTPMVQCGTCDEWLARTLPSLSRGANVHQGITFDVSSSLKMMRVRLVSHKNLVLLKVPSD
jgi:hypothetical protein